MTNTMTEKQVNLINRLKEERDIQGSPEALMALNVLRGRWRVGQATTHAASETIEVLLGTPRLDHPEGDVPDGIHQTPDGQIWKVQIAKQGSGKPYAKRLTVQEPDCGGCQNGDYCDPPCKFKVTFTYAPGKIRDLSEDTLIPAEEAAKFGALYGICVNCGRDLTDERSIEAGYGPVCAANNGWPWG